MSVIKGRAKKFNGEPIDYVLLFDWFTGGFLGKETPDVSGNWAYSYFENLICGIAYVADGCEPVAHGPYNFVYASSLITSGMLMLSRSESTYSDRYDINAVSTATWSDYFEQVQGIGLIDYRYTPVGGVIQTLWQQKIIDDFNSDWVLKLNGTGYLGNNDSYKFTFEVLDKNNNVLFAIQSQKVSGESSGSMSYGANLSSLNQAEKSGLGRVNGNLTFDENGAVYTNSPTDTTSIHSFTFTFDVSEVAKVRVGAESKLGSTSGRFAGSYIQILPPSE